MMFARKQKMMKVTCAGLPQRAFTISHTVCAFGALRFISMARMPKRRTWIVAPLAYQKGPETPYVHATFEDCSSVAAQVHWETMTDAVSPVFTVRPAVLKNSELCSVLLTFLSRYTIRVVKSEKKAPNPRTIPYPDAKGNGVSSPKKLSLPWYSVVIKDMPGSISFAMLRR